MPVVILFSVCLAIAAACIWNLRRGRITGSIAVGAYSALLLALYLAGCVFQSGFAWTSGFLMLLTMPWSLSFEPATHFEWHGLTVYNSLHLNFMFLVVICGGLNCLLLAGLLRVWHSSASKSLGKC